MSKLSVREEEEPSRFTLLETCEKRLFSAFRRGMEASCAMGKELQQIEVQQLYREREFESFNEYAEKYLKMDRRSAHRLIAVSETMDYLRDNLGEAQQLPFNESMAAELTRLPLEHRPIAWQQILEKSDADTVYTVRDGVEDYVREMERIATPRKGVEVDLSEEEEIEEGGNSAHAIEPDTEEKKPEIAAAEIIPPERPTFSEDGERALDRIRRLCGDSVANAIEKGTIKITENHLILWSQQDADRLRNLAYYMVDLRWKFNRALAYEEEAVNNLTTVEELQIRARACGGRVTVQHGGFKIVIEYLA